MDEGCEKRVGEVLQHIVVGWDCLVTSDLLMDQSVRVDYCASWTYS